MTFLPSYGERLETEDGILCHLCGKPYRLLGNHVVHGHKMPFDEYVREFGLSRRRGLITSELRETFRNRPQVATIIEMGKPWRGSGLPDGVNQPTSLEGKRRQVAALRPGIGQQASVDARRAKTHCINGHKYNPDTTRIDSKGIRHCRLCERDNSARKRARLRTRGATPGSVPHDSNG